MPPSVQASRADSDDHRARRFLVTSRNFRLATSAWLFVERRDEVERELHAPNTEARSICRPVASLLPAPFFSDYTVTSSARRIRLRLVPCSTCYNHARSNHR